MCLVGRGLYDAPPIALLCKSTRPLGALPAEPLAINVAPFTRVEYFEDISKAFPGEGLNN
jgi:hypothetical protein